MALLFGVLSKLALTTIASLLSKNVGTELLRENYRALDMDCRELVRRPPRGSAAKEGVSGSPTVDIVSRR